jgi:hypothetical protein
MTDTIAFLRRAGPHDLRMFANPQFWPQRPFLPVIRHPEGQHPEFGLLYDARSSSGKSGYETTVFRAYMTDFLLGESVFLKLPRHIYVSFDELADDGWLVD